MLSAFVVSFTAWIFSFCALAAVSSVSAVIEDTYWVRAKFTLDSTQYSPNGAHVTSYLGINNRVDYVTDASTGVETKTNVAWDDPACAINGVPQQGCVDCKDTALATESWLITACITQIFQMTTDLQRTTVFGDLHCQKMFGTATSIYSAISTLMSLQGFMSDCGGGWSFSSHTTTGTSGIRVEYLTGPGFTLMFLATIFKFYDVICHMLVPVATAQNNYIPEGDGITIEDYMGLNKQPTSWNEAVHEELSEAI